MEEKGKKLGLWNLVGCGLGLSIGTGIFIMMGFGIANTGRAIPIALILGIVAMMLASWAMIVMPTMFVFKGGPFGMQTMLFNPLMTGVSAWFTVASGIAFASMALAITSYLTVLFPGLQPYEKVTAVIILTLAFATTIRGSRFVTIIENLVTVVLVIALVVFIVFGAPKVNAGNYFSSSYDGGFFHNGINGLIMAVAVMSPACMGQTGSAGLSAVAKDPKKNVPLSMIVVALIMCVVYALMGYVASGVLPYDQVAGQNISVAAEAILPKGLFLFFVVGGGICAILSTLLASLGNIRYPLLQVSGAGWLPAVFGRQTKSGYPYITYGVFYLISAVTLVLDLNVSELVSLITIPQLVFRGYMNIACMKLPKKYPEQWEKRSIKMPLAVYQGGCILGTVITAAVIWNMFIGMSITGMVYAALLLVVLFGLAALRLKQGAVKPENLEVQRQAVIDDAIAADAE